MLFYGFMIMFVLGAMMGAAFMMMLPFASYRYKDYLKEQIEIFEKEELGFE